MRRLYGAGPLHLLSLLACFALAGAVVVTLSDEPMRLRYAAWFLGAVVAHDLLLFPLYALLDRSAGALVHRVRRPMPAGSVNYLRVPALLSGLLLLMFSPLVLQRSQPAYGAASGLSEGPYLVRWLVVSGVLFFGSAVLYALRGRPSASSA